MKNLFDPAVSREIQTRIQTLTPGSERQWGRMGVAQMMAHCSLGVDMAAGELKPPRKLMGRLLGGIIKPMALGNDDPMRRNSPTVDGMIVTDECDFQFEQRRLSLLIDRFVSAGPQGCTTHPHAFFGRLTPEEWAILLYKHLDHHLRQFGV